MNPEFLEAIQHFRKEIERIRENRKTVTPQELQEVMNAHQIYLKSQFSWLDRFIIRLFQPSSIWGQA